MAESERLRLEHIEHLKHVHTPKDPLCDHCIESHLTHAEGIRGPSAPECDLEIGLIS